MLLDDFAERLAHCQHCARFLLDFGRHNHAVDGRAKLGIRDALFFELYISF